jgi:hypothetical protein
MEIVTKIGRGERCGVQREEKGMDDTQYYMITWRAKVAALARARHELRKIRIDRGLTMGRPTKAAK